MRRVVLNVDVSSGTVIESNAWMIEWLAPQCSDAQSDAADASGPDPSNRRFSSETEQHACAGGDGCRGDQRFTPHPCAPRLNMETVTCTHQHKHTLHHSRPVCFIMNWWANTQKTLWGHDPDRDLSWPRSNLSSSTEPAEHWSRNTRASKTLSLRHEGLV